MMKIINKTTIKVRNGLTKMKLLLFKKYLKYNLYKS